MAPSPRDDPVAPDDDVQTSPGQGAAQDQPPTVSPVRLTHHERHLALPSPSYATLSAHLAAQRTAKDFASLHDHHHPLNWPLILAQRAVLGAVKESRIANPNSRNILIRKGLDSAHKRRADELRVEIETSQGLPEKEIVRRHARNTVHGVDIGRVRKTRVMSAETWRVYMGAKHVHSQNQAKLRKTDMAERSALMKMEEEESRRSGNI